MSQLREEIAAALRRAGITDADAEARELEAAAEGNRDKGIALAEKRAQGTPLSHLVGTQRFMGVEMLSGPDVLVAREETELLGQSAVSILRKMVADGNTSPRVLEPGTGSGNLSCGIGSAVPEARIWASDITEPCVALTKRNIQRCGLASRVAVSLGDLFGAFAGMSLEKTIDMVIMNPPYIPSIKLAKDRAELLLHEPREAFDGGPYGISIHQRLIRESPQWLKPGGFLLFEFGVGQERQVKALFDRAGTFTEITFPTNSAGEPRVAIAREKS